VVSGGDGSLEPGGALGQWGGDTVTLGRDGRAGTSHIVGELRGGDPGAVGEVGSSGDRLGPAGGRDLQDEGATAAASDTVPGALAVEGEAAGAGDRLAVDGTGAVGGAGQPVGGGAVRSTLGGDRRVDVRGEGDGTGQVSARACGAGRGRRRDEQCRGEGYGEQQVPDA